MQLPIFKKGAFYSIRTSWRDDNFAVISVCSEAFGKGLRADFVQIVPRMASKDAAHTFKATDEGKATRVGRLAARPKL